MWTNDSAEREQFVREIESGQVLVGRVRPARAVRRREAIRVWRRARLSRHPRVCYPEDGVGGKLRVKAVLIGSPNPIDGAYPTM